MMNTAGFWQGASAAFYVMLAIGFVIVLIVVCMLIDRPFLENDPGVRL
jgi:hypothetical protein